MNFADLPNWFICLLVLALFGVAPAVSPLLGPDEVDAARHVAADKKQAPRDQAVAMKGPR